jgi:D-beta-D-heptose 7-phosphate kinase/D-beta-D-heptose 1-phosphate adenosyltransferase
MSHPHLRKMATSPKIKSLDQLVRIRRQLKRKGKRVVFTNGCFDVLHRGHVYCLKKARSLGDILIVGLNSDSSVRKLKGEKRPILPQADRAEILAALEMVDYVLIFKEETPQKVISALVPDRLVKGGDYGKSEIVGSDVVKSGGGRVVRVKTLPGKSTRNIVKKIASRYGRKG